MPELLIKSVNNAELAGALEATHFCLTEILDEESSNIKNSERIVISKILQLINLLINGGKYNADDI